MKSCWIPITSLPPVLHLSQGSRRKMRVKREGSRATDWQLTSAAAACWESSSACGAQSRLHRQAQHRIEKAPHRTQHSSSEEIGHCTEKTTKYSADSPCSKGGQRDEAESAWFITQRLKYTKNFADDMILTILEKTHSVRQIVAFFLALTALSRLSNKSYAWFCLSSAESHFVNDHGRPLWQE